MDDYLGTYLRLLVALPLVLLLAYYGLRYLLKSFGPAFQMGRRVQVVERTALNARTFLYVIRVGNSYLLVSSSPSGVNLLKDLGDNWEEEYPLELAGQTAGEESLTFAGLLSRIKERKNRQDGEK